MGIIRWAANKVQESTGEKERRELVAKTKELFIEFKKRVSEALSTLNQEIDKFNKQIKDLNAIRVSKVRNNIDKLSAFLSKYGNCKASGEYAPESGKIPVEFPEAEKARIEDYIQDIDWSSEEVFRNTLFRTSIGMKMKTKKQNLAMREGLEELQLQIDQTVRELEIRRQGTELEQEICSLYIKNIRFINAFIEEKILPEIELVDAFFEALQIKDKVIADQSLQNAKFSYNLKALVGTPYEKHYTFIRNAFMFYILSCRIYDTPVLTNLLSHNVSNSDLNAIKTEGATLQDGASIVGNAMIMDRGKKVV